MVGKAWIVTQLIALSFAALTIARLAVRSDLLDKAALAAGGLVLAVTSVTGHAIDDSFTWFTQASFLLHTCAGLTWIGGLLGLVYWMFTGRNKPPEVAAKLAERWSLIAKIAIALVVATGLVMAWENVGGFANLLATTYGRLADGETRPALRGDAGGASFGALSQSTAARKNSTRFGMAGSGSASRSPPWRFCSLRAGSR